MSCGIYIICKGSTDSILFVSICRTICAIRNAAHPALLAFGRTFTPLSVIYLRSVLCSLYERGALRVSKHSSHLPRSQAAFVADQQETQRDLPSLPLPPASTSTNAASADVVQKHFDTGAVPLFVQEPNKTRVRCVGYIKFNTFLHTSL